MTAAELAKLLLEYAEDAKQAQPRPEHERALAEVWLVVARWAAGRIPIEAVGHSAALDRRDLRDAAVLFLRKTCFRAGATFYQMFGMRRSTFTREVLRKRYRALIRLAHPDVGVKGFPTGAAGAVNRAYTVLNDDRLRQRYDELLRSRKSKIHVASTVGAERATDGDKASAMVRLKRRLRKTVAAWRESVLARWVRTSTRWGRRLTVGLAIFAAFVAVSLLVWNVGHLTDANTIIAVAPRDANLGPTPGVPVKRRDFASGADSVRRHVADARGLKAAATAEDDEAAADVMVKSNGVWSQLGKIDLHAGVPAAGGSAKSNHRVALTQDMLEAEQFFSVSGVRAGAMDSISAASWQAARHYVESVALAVDDEARARRLDRELADAGVRGTLLQPVLALYRQYDQLTVEYLMWSTTEQDELPDARAVLVVQGEVGGVRQAVHLYRLHAKFEDTAEGGRLHALDLLVMD